MNAKVNAGAQLGLRERLPWRMIFCVDEMQDEAAAASGFGGVEPADEQRRPLLARSTEADLDQRRIRDEALEALARQAQRLFSFPLRRQVANDERGRSSSPACTRLWIIEA
jgi:hypothetical protein